MGAIPTVEEDKDEEKVRRPCLFGFCVFVADSLLG